MEAVGSSVLIIMTGEQAGGAEWSHLVSLCCYATSALAARRDH